MGNGLDYREIAPSQALLPYIECYWTIRATRHDPAYPVLPDGCADLLFSSAVPTPELQLVGCMTAAQSSAFDAGTELFGVRFRPAMASLFVRAPWHELTDKTAPADGTRMLASQIGEANSGEKRIAAVEKWLRMVKDPGPVQRLANRAGNLRIDELSRQAGLSVRQLRRIFLAETGLSPKHLYRVLRFRRAVQQMARAPQSDFASLALDAGYYDQAHFINEFREFSGGYSPAAWQNRRLAQMADFSNPVLENPRTLGV